MKQYIMYELYLKRSANPNMGINQDESILKIREPLEFQNLIPEAWIKWNEMLYYTNTDERKLQTMTS